MDTTIFSQRLKQLIANKGTSDADVAYSIGITPAAICRYQQGARLPSMECLIKIASYFGVSIDWLIGNDNKKTTEFTEEEEILLNLYRMASKQDREVIFLILSKYKGSIK